MNKTASVPGARGGVVGRLVVKNAFNSKCRKISVTLRSACSTKQLPRTVKMVTQRNSISKTNDNNKINF